MVTSRVQQKEFLIQQPRRSKHHKLKIDAFQNLCYQNLLEYDEGQFVLHKIVIILFKEVTLLNENLSATLNAALPFDCTDDLGRKLESSCVLWSFPNFFQDFRFNGIL